MKFDYQEIKKACEILGIEDTATLSEINSRFRILAKRYHPDTQESKESEEKFKEISWAYNLLLKFISSYRYSFRKEDVEKANFDTWTYKALKRFYDGWWGDLPI